jgi:hypothetical protein
VASRESRGEVLVSDVAKARDKAGALKCLGKLP